MSSFTTVVTQVAGFICSEGQAAADMKKMMYTFAVVIVFFVLMMLAYQSKKHSMLKAWLAVIVGIIAAIAMYVIGPFFYNSWGCS